MPARRAICCKITIFILAAACLYLLGNGQVSLWDRDEPRYAQTSRQMLQSGDWVVPHFLDEVRTAKPVLIYWCQAAAMSAMGENSFAARFPSALTMILTLIVVAVVVYRAIGPQRALWTTFILGSSGLGIFCAKFCTTDAVLLLWMTMAQICLYARWRGSRSWSVLILMSIAIGLGGLTKGPIILGVMISTALALFALRRSDSERRGVRPIGISAIQVVVAIVIVTAIVTPWLYLIQQRVPGYLKETFWKEIYDRARRPQEGHKGPPGYYLASIWVTYFPWSLLLPATIVQAWKRRHIPVIRFCLAATIGPWLMFEVVATKLPHYVLPIFPPLAFLTADMLVRAARRLHQDITNPGFPWIVLAWGILIVVVSFVPWLGVKVFKDQTALAAWWWIFVLTIIVLEYAREIYVYFQRRQPTRAAAVMGFGMMIFFAAFYAGYLRHADFLKVSKRIAIVLRLYGAHDVMMIGYKEPSLAFYQGGTIREQRDNLFLQTHPSQDWPDWLVMTESLWRQVPPAAQGKFELVDSVRGWNYSDRGRIVEVLVLCKKSENIDSEQVDNRTDTMIAK
jgi:4-amino-4-deoxy-L-arabinose transferase-like glycosyltransferase